MRLLADKNVVRRWFESILRSNMSQALTKEQELVVSILATARSQAVEIYITLETYHILTHILTNPSVARAIISNTEVLYPSKPFSKWLKVMRSVTALAKEDAKIVCYATFGTNLSGTILGCSRVITLDKALANEFELRKSELETRLHRLAKRLPHPFPAAKLPELTHTR